MKRILTLLVLTVAFTSYVDAQAKPDPAAAPVAPPSAPGAQKVTPKAPYDSTKAQLWAEKQKNLQMLAAQLQSQYQQGMKDLGDKFNPLKQSMDAWVGAVRTANGWDDTYTWDPETDTWSHTPKSAAPAEPAKK